MRRKTTQLDYSARINRVIDLLHLRLDETPTLVEL